MKSLLTAIVCLAAAITAFAAETPGQFAGRWLAIVKPYANQKSDVPVRRALLTFDVSDHGFITNGVLRAHRGANR